MKHIGLAVLMILIFGQLAAAQSSISECDAQMRVESAKIDALMTSGMEPIDQDHPTITKRTKPPSVFSTMYLLLTKDELRQCIYMWATAVAREQQKCNWNGACMNAAIEKIQHDQKTWNRVGDYVNAMLANRLEEYFGKHPEIVEGLDKIEKDKGSPFAD